MTINYLKNNKQVAQFISNNKCVTVLYVEDGTVVKTTVVPLPTGRVIYKKLVEKGFTEVKPSYRKVKSA